MGDSNVNGNQSSELIVSNILCYITTARNQLRNDDIVRVCLSFYSPDDILAGKDLLFETVGERVIRRRNDNRILHELQDVMELLKKCDDEGLKLPKFVADSYCGLPPTSGFEVVAHHMIELNEQLVALKKEVEILRDVRAKDNLDQQNSILMQEDLITIKGELRKLNHKLLAEDLRRTSMLLNTVNLDSDGSSVTGDIEDKTSRNAEFVATNEKFKCPPSRSPDICVAPVGPLECRDGFVDSNLNRSNASPSAPPPSQEQWMERLMNDDGGTPSAPSFSQVCREGLTATAVTAVLPDGMISDASRNRNINTNKMLTAVIDSSDVDSEGFKLVKNKKRDKKIVGLKNSPAILKSAVRQFDLYVGNCDVEVTNEQISEYIHGQFNIKVRL